MKNITKNIEKLVAVFNEYEDCENTIKNVCKDMGMNKHELKELIDYMHTNRTGCIDGNYGSTYDNMYSDNEIMCMTINPLEDVTIYRKDGIREGVILFINGQVTDDVSIIIDLHENNNIKKIINYKGDTININWILEKAEAFNNVETSQEMINILQNGGSLFLAKKWLENVLNDKGCVFHPEMKKALYIWSVDEFIKHVEKWQNVEYCG